MNTDLKIGDKAQGGIIAYIHETGKHGLVCSLDDLGEFDWDGAKKACKEYDANGFSDWYLPSKFELNLLLQNLHLKNVGGFSSGNYWSSTELDSINAWEQNFYIGALEYYYKFNKTYSRFVRAVRAFSCYFD